MAVDQSDGSVYVAAYPGDKYRIWRYAPSSPSGTISDADYTVTGITVIQPRELAADSGSIYAVVDDVSQELRRFSAADFAANAPQVEGSLLTSDVTAVAVDPQNGDVYANRGGGVAVFDSTGALQYEFGAAAYFGNESQGIAVKSAVSGPATKAYVADPTSNHEVDVFGGLTLAATYTHDTIASFGPDGTPATNFESRGIDKLAVDQSARRLYALEGVAPGIYGFDASSPSAFSVLTGFSPLATAIFGKTNDADHAPGLAVDSTALPSAGNVYLVSQKTDLLYGFDHSGTPLAGFPVDPATSPGPPDGSPKDLCGAAVDSSGNVWVSNFEAKRILKYSSAGTSLPGAINTSAQGGPCQLAFDSDGDLYVTHSKGVYKYSAASGYTSATQVANLASTGNGISSLSITVDPSDDHLFIASGDPCSGCDFEIWVDEYDPAGNLLDEFATGENSAYRGIAVDPANGYVYLADDSDRRIRVLGSGYLLPEPRLNAASALANTTTTLNGTVVSQGVVVSDCHFEYVSETSFRLSGFSDLSSGGSASCSPSAGSIPLDLDEHAVSANVTGLTKNTTYRLRLVASNIDGTATSEEASFATSGPPEVETTGTPLRTATTAQLLGRLNPVRAATTYHFEFGSEGPCDSNPCASTADQPAGSGDQVVFVAENLEGLTPDTTYHYRLVADNGNPDGPAFGEDMIVTPRASDAPLTHGDFAGPPGSDRAYELVSMPDSGGNPVGLVSGFADDGNSAIYSVAGGTPISEGGSFFSLYYAKRTAKGWLSSLPTPPREQLLGANWANLAGRGDLTSVVSVNNEGEEGEDVAFWRLATHDQAIKLFEPVVPQEALGWSAGGFRSASSYGVSADGSRVLIVLQGGALDPVHPDASVVPNLYDVSVGGDPQLVSFLPGEALAACGVARNEASLGAFGDPAAQASHWISDDGSTLFFPSRGEGPCSGGGAARAQLYLRDLAASETKFVSGPALSGPPCDSGFLRGTADAAFFVTNARLDTEDTATAECTGSNDVYRYDLEDEDLECLTCVVEGLEADVVGNGPDDIAPSEDGSRLYFASEAHMLAGAPPAGAPAIYRLDVASGELAYVAPGSSLGYTQLTVGITPDGSTLIFRSNSAALNPLGGSDNDGTPQYYRYDDADRSLVCVSCPQDGSPATGMPLELVAGSPSVTGSPVGQPNITALSDDGKTLAFSTSTRLLGADQNSAGLGEDSFSGRDVYEWRDGRVLLVTDGLTSWSLEPIVEGVSASGKDIFFGATAKYTPDALDNNRRIYDARIGGGILFPKPPPPCPLEVCQGTPKGAPEDQAPGSTSFTGPGNAEPVPNRKCRKGKVRRRGRCVAKQKKPRQHKRANQKRRNGR